MIPEDQPHQDEKDHLPQCIHHGTLHKTDASDPFYFGQFKTKYFERIFIQAGYLLLCKSKAFYQFNITE